MAGLLPAIVGQANLLEHRGQQLGKKGIDWLNDHKT
jgi:hypothetical protein